MKTLLLVSIFASMTAFAASKISIEDAKAVLSQYAEPGSQCEADVAALTPESLCPSLRTALASCEVTAVDENGNATDVANVVECREESPATPAN